MTEITIPCHWDKNIINQIAVNNKKDIAVKEVYGALSGGGPVGHGRSRKSVIFISRKKAEEFRQYLKKQDIRFTYLLNAPFEFNNTEKQRSELRDYLNWILLKLKPDALTIASLELMEYVRQMNPDISIHISTIAGVKKAGDLNKFLCVKPDRVVTHHDIGKHWKDLAEIVKFGKSNSMDVEILSTESCLLGCPNRSKHYKFLAKENKDKVFHLTCNLRKLIYPREFLLAGGVIRPEDLVIFEQMGVKYFKLTGRSKNKNWLPEVARAYQERNYDGNLIRLLGIAPEMNAEEWIYISNKSLEGFLKKYPQTGSYSDEVDYCDNWIVKLYNEGNFKLLDGSIYKAEKGMLKLKNPGSKAMLIIKKEMGISKLFINE